MGRAEPSLNLGVKNLWLMLSQYWLRLITIINGQIGFGNGVTKDNLNLAWGNVVTPGAPNTDFGVVHNLGRVPVGYIVVSKSAAVDVYTGSVAATITTLTLRATVAGVAIRVMIF